MLIGYVGVFKGTATQNGKVQGTFEAIVALVGGRVNGTVGMVYYDLAGITHPPVADRQARTCAPLELVSVSNDKVVLQEGRFLIKGRANYSKMTLKLLPTGDLEYSFLAENGDTGSGTLHRVEPLCSVVLA